MLCAALIEKEMSALNNTDTITAMATPAGRGGIAIVRVSGSLTQHIIKTLLGVDLIPREATYLPFRDLAGEVIDEGIAIYFPNPHSFTGEDILELQGHGGPVVVDTLLQTILQTGARMARPGEFSERAFLNGKIDLAQAEAIADLIDASSKQAARSALRSMQGEFSKAVYQLNEKVIHLRMYIEAAIDFSDEEIDFLADTRIQEMLQAILSAMQQLLKDAKQGTLLREGITAVIAGAPNVGKSSLLNCLSGKEVAIVTDIPGTTRDVLRDYILIDGMPMHVIDTAGLRESTDVVEQEGIRRAQQEIATADLILYVFSAEEANPEINDTTLSSFMNSESLALSTKPVLYIRNKIDLCNDQAEICSHQGKPVVSLSAKSALGIDLLKDQIKKQVGLQSETDGLFSARRRHLDALERAKQHLHAAAMQLQQASAGELAAEDLRLAQLALCEITGEFSADDLLGRIFASFCIGK